MADTWVDSDASELGEYESTSSYESYCFCGKFVASSSYTCNRLGIYSHADPVNDPAVKLAIYADSGGAPTGSPLVESSPVTVNGGSQWFDVDVSNTSITNGNTYHIGHITSAAPSTQWRYRNATPANGASHYDASITYPTFPSAPDAGPSSRRYGAYRMGYGDAATYKMEGVTKDKDGSVLATCDCFLFKLNAGEDDATYVDYDESDVSGNYSFTGITDNDAKYFVVAWKDNTPHVMDCTDHVLVGVEE
jgi:hypothetical protein